jgi:hypothetical protein
LAAVEEAGAGLAAAGFALSAGLALAPDFAPSPELAEVEAESAFTTDALLSEPLLFDPLAAPSPLEPSLEEAAGLVEA